MRRLRDFVCEACGKDFQAREMARRFCSGRCAYSQNKNLKATVGQSWADVGRTINPAIERIWEKVTRFGPDECWDWPGAHTMAGYGVILENGRSFYVTRLVLSEKLGRELLPSMQACHTCDRPPCCNPSHLFEGTQLDNMKDMATKGRAAKGQRHHWATLTDAQVTHIRSVDSSAVELAHELGVTPRHVRKIRQGVRRVG